jgi:hypothetical protein
VSEHFNRFMSEKWFRTNIHVKTAEMLYMNFILRLEAVEACARARFKIVSVLIW